MARVKRRVRRQSQQFKKSRTSDHMNDHDAMDLDHSGVDENVMEKLEKGDADFTHGDDDGSDNAGRKEQKKMMKMLLIVATVQMMTMMMVLML
eukprot:7529159-Ditylum_brightwellii.AAC.1